MGMVTTYPDVRPVRISSWAPGAVPGGIVTVVSTSPWLSAVTVSRRTGVEWSVTLTCSPGVKPGDCTVTCWPACGEVVDAVVMGKQFVNCDVTPDSVDAGQDMGSDWATAPVVMLNEPLLVSPVVTDPSGTWPWGPSCATALA